MKNISSFDQKIKVLFTDIDDTLTNDGRLEPEAYSSLWKLSQVNIKVVPVTGRPAGWCELIARMWPVAGVIGENGGFYFRYHNKKMHRKFYFSDEIQKRNREKLNLIQKEILEKAPRSQLASDQFCRLMDLAIDFCEDVPRLDEKDIKLIVSLFEAHGAKAKVSSIHVNGWFGDYDKLTMTQIFSQDVLGLDTINLKKYGAFSGDSLNDEPMFEFFPNSFAVANIVNFIPQLQYCPSYISSKNGGQGFVEIADQIIHCLTK